MRGWLNFEFHPDVLSQISFSYADLTKLIFTLEPHLCKNQAKCISHLIISTAGTHANPAMETAKRDIGMKVIALVPLISPALAEKNEPMVECFQTIFTTLGQTYMDKILEDPNSELYGILLKLLAYPGGKARHVCKFWKKLFKEIYGTTNEDVKKTKVEKMQETFKTALSVCVQLVQLPEGTFIALNKSSITAEEFSDVIDGRYYYQKIVKYIGGCLGAKNSWILIRDRFKNDIDLVGSNPTSVTYWTRLEATLTALGSLLECQSFCSLNPTAKLMQNK